MHGLARHGGRSLRDRFEKEKEKEKEKDYFAATTLS